MQELQNSKKGYKSIIYYGKRMEIPEEWEITNFGHECYVTSGSTPSRRHPEYFKGNIPWVSSGELNYAIIVDTIEHITMSAVKEANLRLLPKGTFLIAITGLEATGTRGRCAILGVDATTNQSCIAFHKSDRIHTDFLFYFYQQFSERIISSLAQGTKQQSLNLELVKSIKIFLPTLEEQKRIAYTISILDKLIQKIDQVINETQTLKEGLLRKLFIKGIGHKKFKKTEIGEIPEEWQIQKLEQIAIKITDGTHFTPTYTLKGIPFLRVTDIQEEKINWKTVKRIPISEHNELTKRCKPQQGDILLSKNGTVGLTKLVDWNIPFSIFVSLCLIKPKHDKVYNCSCSC